MGDDTQDEPDKDRVQDTAEQRQRERGQRSESVIEQVQLDFNEHEYPVRGEELAAEYSIEELDMPNETESLGSVFDRLADEQFESAEDAREAVYGELTGEAGGRDEYNEERELGELEEEDDRTRGNRDI